MAIEGISSGINLNDIARQVRDSAGKEAASSKKPEEFGKVLGETLNRVNDLQVQADKAIENFVTGESKGLHEVMIAVEKSNISFQFLNQVRNKALDAYHEIMRMQV